jgi:hypothetical protein
MARLTENDWYEGWKQAITLKACMTMFSKFQIRVPPPGKSVSFVE